MCASLGVDADPNTPLFPSPINNFHEITNLFQVCFCDGVPVSTQQWADVSCESKSFESVKKAGAGC